MGSDVAQGQGHIDKCAKCTKRRKKKTVKAISRDAVVPHHRGMRTARLTVACLDLLPALHRLYLIPHWVPAAAAEG